MTQLYHTHSESNFSPANEDSIQRYNVPSICITDRTIQCPVDHTQPSGPCLQVFVRQCARAEATSNAHSKWLLFLQGGPGFECSSSVPSNSGMLKVLLDRGYVVLLLDQRGTGMSTPITSETLRLQGDVDQQVQYCKQFRADSIVMDCEIVREALHIPKWTLLAQSFGGFCALTYLSRFPEYLEAAIITGGMAPFMYDQPDPVYRRLVRKLMRRNESFYEKHPRDVSRVKRIVHHLDSNDLQTPNGGHLTSRRFRQIGLDLGMHGGFDRMHNIVIKLVSDLDQFGILTYKSREMLEHALHFDSNPIYAILHESIYCQSSVSSNWSSQRVLEAHPEFAVSSDAEQPIFFFGENIFPWMFDDYSELRSMKAVAERLAQEPWTPLYDTQILAHNKVPIAASCYLMDMYVEIDLAIESLQALGSSKDLITNRWLHNALRHAPEELLGYLFNLLQDVQP